MKARIKSTGDIMPIAPYAKVTLDVCDDRGTPYEVDFEDIELINEDESAGNPDWSSFRREAAKVAMEGILASGDGWSLTLAEGYKPAEKHSYPIGIARFAIACADELIRQLKEEKK